MNAEMGISKNQWRSTGGILSGNVRAVGTRGADPLLLHFDDHLSICQGQIDHLITAYPPGISDLSYQRPWFKSDPRQFVTSLFSSLIGGTANQCASSCNFQPMRRQFITNHVFISAGILWMSNWKWARFLLNSSIVKSDTKKGII